MAENELNIISRPASVVDGGVSGSGMPAPSASAPQPSLVAPAKVPVATGALAVAPRAGEMRVYTPESSAPSYGGRSLPNLTADWSVWTAATSVKDRGPLDDLDGTRWMVGQDSRNKVLFLVGVMRPTGATVSTIPSPVTRNINVSQGKILLVPVVTRRLDELNTRADVAAGKPPTDGSSFTDLRAKNAAIMDTATGTVTVDGKSVEVVRVVSPEHHIEFPTGSTHPNDPEGVRAKADNEGLYAVIDTSKLPKGVHTIVIHGEIPKRSFSLDVTYKVTVK